VSSTQGHSSALSGSPCLQGPLCTERRVGGLLVSSSQTPAACSTNHSVLPLTRVLPGPRRGHGGQWPLLPVVVCGLCRQRLPRSLWHSGFNTCVCPDDSSTWLLGLSSPPVQCAPLGCQSSCTAAGHGAGNGTFQTVRLMDVGSMISSVPSVLSECVLRLGDTFRLVLS